MNLFGNGVRSFGLTMFQNSKNGKAALATPHAGGQLSNITSAGVSGLEGSGVCMRDGGIAR